MYCAWLSRNIKSYVLINIKYCFYKKIEIESGLSRNVKFGSTSSLPKLVFNTNNFIFTTTNHLSFKITNMSEVYSIIDCSHQSDDIMDDIHDFHKYLVSWDIKHFKSNNIPMTNLRKDNIIYHAPAYIHCMQDRINKFKDKTIPIHEIFDMCEEYSRQNNKYINRVRLYFNEEFRAVFGKYYNNGVYCFKDLTEKKIDKLIDKHYVNKFI
jgi:hypothetical protein